MSQPFSDALSWVPRTRALSATLSRAHDLARAHGHSAVGLDHLLLALTEDPDASGVLSASGVDLAGLANDVGSHIVAIPDGDASTPAADEPLLRILEYAVAAAQQSRRREVNGGIVLAAIVGEGKSDAAAILRSHGMTFAAAIEAIKGSGRAPPPQAAPPAGGVPAEGAADPGTDSASPATEEILARARRRVEAKQTAPPAPPAPVMPAVAAAPEPKPASPEPPPPVRAPTPAFAPPPAPEPPLRAEPPPPPARESVQQLPLAETAAILRDLERTPAHTASGYGDGDVARAPPGYTPPDPVPSSRPVRPEPVPHARAPRPPEPGREPVPAPRQHQPEPAHAPSWLPPSASPGPPEPARAPPRAPPTMPPLSSPLGRDQGYAPYGDPLAATSSPPPESIGGYVPGAAGPPRGAPWPDAGSNAPAGDPEPRTGRRRRPPEPGEANGGHDEPASPSRPRKQRRNGQQRDGGPARGIDTARLATAFPRRLRAGVPVEVEIRIARADIAALGTAYAHEDIVGTAMSLRVRVAKGVAIHVEPASAETQWVDAATGRLSDDEAVWRWTVTAHRGGRARLQVVASARTIGVEGTASETALPDQAVDVRVSGKVLPRLAWLATMAGTTAAGAALDDVAEPFVMVAVSVARQMLGLP